jgi:multiple sugar transport system substrate-binding protein
MWLDAAQLGPALEDPAKSKIAGKVGYAALKGQGGQDYIVGAVWGFSVAAATKHQQQAWKLVQFLTGAKTGAAQVVSGTNGSSGRADVLADPAAQKALNPGFVSALTEAVAHTNPRYTPLIPQGQQIRGALALELSNSLSKGRTPEATMKAAQAQVQGLLK